MATEKELEPRRIAMSIAHMNDIASAIRVMDHMETYISAQLGNKRLDMDKIFIREVRRMLDLYFKDRYGNLTDWMDAHRILTTRESREEKNGTDSR